MTPFEVKDCALLVRMSGLSPATNLRELRERFAACSWSVLFHHYCETTLRTTYDNLDYRNDFAVWAKLYLGDRVLAERLGILDPYSFQSLKELRAATLEVIDQRLSESAMVPWARHGDEFFFMEATTVVFDAGIRITQPSLLGAFIREMTNGSVYYHFLEARRRLPIGMDDFTAWLLKDEEANQPYIRALASVDFYFRSLPDLRRELARVLTEAEAAK
ncbi:MAG: conserved hypothetical cytosolic protein [Deltaproteobacteria bacterium]|jgi:hypothetical protein|nr:conserved hypothetical cytosolic protein [Deltaproteobacteria bacterium]